LRALYSELAELKAVICGLADRDKNSGGDYISWLLAKAAARKAARQQ